MKAVLTIILYATLLTACQVTQHRTTTAGKSAIKLNNEDSVFVAALNEQLKRYRNMDHPDAQYIIDVTPPVITWFRENYPPKLVLTPAEYRSKGNRLRDVRRIDVKYVVTINSSNTLATVTMTHTIGPLGSAGYTVNLKRNRDGSWKVLSLLLGALS